MNLATMLAILDEANDNTWIGTANGDFKAGGAQAELLLSDAGNDWILGGGGNDFISTHEGNDRMEGGTGTDVFSITREDVNFSGDVWKDQIRDFESDVDGIVFNNHATYGFGNIGYDDLNFESHGQGNWTITVDGFSGYELLVHVIGQGNFQESDFLFDGA